jgi:hypothetical protein
VHKLRNILEHLPEGQRPWVRAIVARAYKQAEVATARRLLQDLARRLEDRYPSAAASVREGLEETLTVLTLQLSDRLRQSLATTNAIESLISRSRHVKRNVKRWRGGKRVLRWTAAAILEAVKGITLPAGQYLFRLPDPYISGKVVQVLSADGTKPYGPFFTYAAERIEPADTPEVRFMETAKGMPAAIKTWWYPGERTGYEFTYRKTRRGNSPKVPANRC